MKRIIIFLSIILCINFIQAQNPKELFNNWYQLDTTISFPNLTFSESSAKDYLTRVTGHHLYFCKVAFFAPMQNNYTGQIYAIDLENHRLDSISVSYPSTLSNWKRDAREFSVSDLFLQDGKLLITTNYKTMLFERKNNKYEFVKQLFTPNLITTNICQAYCHKGKLYLFTYDRTQGITSWLRYNDKDEKMHSIAQFQDKVMVLDQMTSRGVTKLSNNFVYIQPYGEKYINKYSLDGKLVDSVYFGFSGWKEFTDEFISEIKARPYGVERISYAMKHQFKQYDFARKFIPINDSLYLLSFNLGGNDVYHWFSTMRLYRQNGIWHHDFSSFDTLYNSMIFDNDLYPAIPIEDASLLGSFAYDGQLLQFFYGPNLPSGMTEKQSYQGLRRSNYYEKVEDYYADSWPILKIRKQQIRLPYQFHDSHNQEVDLSQIPHSKVIVMINRQPQCSGCQKHLMRLFSNIDTSEVSIVMLFENMEGSLNRRQNAKALADICPLSYTPLYIIPGQDYGTLLNHNSYPAIYMYQRGFGFIGVFETNKIFTEDITKYEYSDSFTNAFTNFTQKEKQ